MKNPPDGVRVRNVYFDVTPPELVSRFVTEKGIFTAAGIRRIRDRLLSSVPDFLKQKAIDRGGAFLPVPGGAVVAVPRKLC